MLLELWRSDRSSSFPVKELLHHGGMKFKKKNCTEQRLDSGLVSWFEMSDQWIWALQYFLSAHIHSHSFRSLLWFCLLGKGLPVLITVIRNKSIWWLLWNRLYCGVSSVFWDTNFSGGQNLGYRFCFRLLFLSVEGIAVMSIHLPFQCTPVGTNVKEASRQHYH